MLTERKCGLSLALLILLFFRSAAGGPVEAHNSSAVPRVGGIHLV